jgi:hypothetical protein
LISGKFMDSFYGILGNLIASAIVGLGTIYGKLSRRNG